MAKMKNPYTFPHRSKAAMIDYICGIGGYHSSRHDCYPLSFNVKAYSCNFDFDHIWKRAAVDINMDVGPSDSVKNDPAQLKAYQDLARELHKKHEEHLWGWGQEDTWRGVKEDDTHRCLWSGESYTVEYGLVGRSGGHLVVEHWNGFTFRGMSPEDLRERLEDKGDSLHADLRFLYKCCRHWEHDFTCAKASAEVEYQGIWNFFANIVEPAWEDRKKEIADHEELVECYGEVVKALGGLSGVEGISARDCLDKLAVSCGITEDERSRA